MGEIDGRLRRYDMVTAGLAEGQKAIGRAGVVLNMQSARHIMIA
jgi:hypothetical protein